MGQSRPDARARRIGDRLAGCLVLSAHSVSCVLTTHSKCENHTEFSVPIWGSGIMISSVRYPVLRNEIILTPSFSPTLRFQTSIHFSKSASCFLTCVRPRSSQIQHVATPSTESAHERKVVG